MIEYLDEENDINVNEEVIRLNTYFQDVMLSKSLRVFSMAGYSLYEFNIFVNEFNNDMIILNYKLLNEKLNRVIHFDIIFEFNKDKDVESCVFLKHYKLEKSIDMFGLINKFNKLLLKDRELMVNLEYYLMKYYDKNID